MFCHLTDDELLVLAVRGATDAAAMCDPATSAPFRQWVFFGALGNVLANARAGNERHAKLIARMRARSIVHLQQWTGRVLDAGTDGEAEVGRKLQAISDGFYQEVLKEQLAPIAARVAGDDR